MTSMTGTRRLVISVVVLAVAAVIVMMMLVSRPKSSAMAGMAGMDHGSGATSESAPATAGSGSSDDMAGMDHGAGHSPESTPTPSMSEDMPGMDHGTGHSPESTPTPSMSEDMPGMDHGTADTAEPGHGTADTAVADPDRPLAPVLGAFGGGTSAVLLTAGLLRRKDRAADRVKQAARAARRSQK